MAEQKFSDFTLETPNLTDSYLAGLHEGDNARFSLAAINSLIQGDIDTVAPLPDGTYAKVMYYTSGAGWGASANFVTDGTNVAIGLNNTSAFSSRLTVVDFDGEKEYLLGLIGDTNRSFTYSKYGIGSFNVTASNGLGVLDETYADIVCARFGLKTIHSKDLILNANNGTKAALVFADFNISDGTFNNERKIFPTVGAINIDTPTLNLTQQASTQDAGLIIRSTGKVEQNPTVLVRATSNIGGTTPTTGLIINWNNEVYDNKNALSGTTFTAPYSGYYQVSWRLQWINQSYQNQESVTSLLLLNDNSYAAGTVTYAFVTMTFSPTSVGNTTLFLNANDTLTIRASSTRNAGAPTLGIATDEQFLTITKLF